MNTFFLALWSSLKFDAIKYGVIALVGLISVSSILYIYYNKGKVACENNVLQTQIVQEKKINTVFKKIYIKPITKINKKDKSVVDCLYNVKCVP